MPSPPLALSQPSRLVLGCANPRACARSCPALLHPSVSPAARCSGRHPSADAHPSANYPQAKGRQAGTPHPRHTQGRQGRRNAAKGYQIRKPPQAQSKMEASAKSTHLRSKPIIVYIGRIKCVPDAGTAGRQAHRHPHTQHPKSKPATG